MKSTSKLEGVRLSSPLLPPPFSPPLPPSSLRLRCTPRTLYSLRQRPDALATVPTSGRRRSLPRGHGDNDRNPHLLRHPPRTCVDFLRSERIVVCRRTSHVNLICIANYALSPLPSFDPPAWFSRTAEGEAVSPSYLARGFKLQQPLLVPFTFPLQTSNPASQSRMACSLSSSCSSHSAAPLRSQPMPTAGPVIHETANFTSCGITSLGLPIQIAALRQARELDQAAAGKGGRDRNSLASSSNREN